MLNSEIVKIHINIQISQPINIQISSSCGCSITQVAQTQVTKVTKVTKEVIQTIYPKIVVSCVCVFRGLVLCTRLRF